MNQANFEKVNPNLIYELSKKIMLDLRYVPKNQTAASFVQDKYRVDSYLYSLLNKIPEQNAFVTNNFIECLNSFNDLMMDTPRFFGKTLNKTLQNTEDAQQD